MIEKLKQILEKLKNPHIVNLVGNAIMSVLNMVQVAILFNYLPKDKMGYGSFSGTIGLVDTFRAGLITTAFITSYAGTSKERSAEVAGSAWFLSSLVTVVFIAANLVYLAIPYHVPDFGTNLFITWFGLVFVITLPSFIASCVAQAEARFDRLLIIRSVSTSLSIILVLTLIITKNVNLMNVVYTGFIAGGATSLMTIVLGWSRINTFLKKSTETVKSLFAFGKYSVGTSLGSSMFRNSDNYIIKIMFPGPKGDSVIAVYNLGLRLTELIEIPLRSFAATIMPPLSAAHNQNNKYHVIYLIKKYSGLAYHAHDTCGDWLIAFAEVGIWIVDKEYLTTEAANILRIFMSFAMLYPIERFMALALDATNQPQVNAVKLVFMLAANIIGDFVGIWLFGNVYGVAFGTLLPILTGMVISYRWLQRYEKFQLWDVYKIGWLETQWLIKDTWAMLFKKKEAKAE